MFAFSRKAKHLNTVNLEASPVQSKVEWNFAKVTGFSVVVASVSFGRAVDFDGGSEGITIGGGSDQFDFQVMNFFRSVKLLIKTGMVAPFVGYNIQSPSSSRSRAAEDRELVEPITVTIPFYRDRAILFIFARTISSKILSMWLFFEVPHPARIHYREIVPHFHSKALSLSRIGYPMPAVTNTFETVCA